MSVASLKQYVHNNNNRSHEPNNGSNDPINGSNEHEKKEKPSIISPTSLFNTNVAEAMSIKRSGSFSVNRVYENNVLFKDGKAARGYKKINQYTIIKDIGRGLHGKVKLCYDEVCKRYVAMKIINKIPAHIPASQYLVRGTDKKLQKQSDLVKAHLYNIKKEIAIMKACDHPNIVKIYEVIDDPNENKMYLRTYFALPLVLFF